MMTPADLSGGEFFLRFRKMNCPTPLPLLPPPSLSPENELFFSDPL